MTFQGLCMMLKQFNGQISIKNLPPNYGLIVSLQFFEVDNLDAGAPLDEEILAEDRIDCIQIYSEVNLDLESQESLINIPFSIEHYIGYFYIQVRVIMFRKNQNRAFAQLETFFFGSRPLPFLDNLTSIIFPVEWPSVPVEQLENHNRFTPQNN